jgi:hypothetical protein
MKSLITVLRTFKSGGMLDSYKYLGCYAPFSTSKKDMANGQSLITFIKLLLGLQFFGSTTSRMYGA